jgi:hypothetical protein
LCAARQIRSGHDDEIEAFATRGLEAAEALTHQPPGPVPDDGASQLATRGNAQAVVWTTVRQRNHREQPPSEAPASPEDPVEVATHPQAPLTPEPQAHAPALRPKSGRQSLATLLPPPLQNHATALGPHPNQEPVGALPLPVPGLKRPLHC